MNNGYANNEYDDGGWDQGYVRGRGRGRGRGGFRGRERGGGGYNGGPQFVDVHQDNRGYNYDPPAPGRGNLRETLKNLIDFFLLKKNVYYS